MQGATDLLGCDRLAVGPVQPVPKALVADLSDLPGLPHVDNVGDHDHGPRLPGGRRTVLMVSDDNFSSTRTTPFLAFAVTGITACGTP